MSFDIDDTNLIKIIELRRRLILSLRKFYGLIGLVVITLSIIITYQNIGRIQSFVQKVVQFKKSFVEDAYRFGGVFIKTPLDSLEIDGLHLISKADVLDKIYDTKRNKLKSSMIDLQKALKSLPLVESVFIRRVISQKLLISIKEKNIISIVDTSDGFFYLDQYGVQIQRVQQFNEMSSALPIVINLNDRNIDVFLNAYKAIASLDMIRFVKFISIISNRRVDLVAINDITFKLPKNDVIHAVQKIKTMHEDFGILSSEVNSSNNIKYIDLVVKGMVYIGYKHDIR